MNAFFNEGSAYQIPDWTQGSEVLSVEFPSVMRERQVEEGPAATDPAASNPAHGEQGHRWPVLATGHEVVAWEPSHLPLGLPGRAQEGTSERSQQVPAPGCA